MDPAPRDPAPARAEDVPDQDQDAAPGPSCDTVLGDTGPGAGPRTCNCRAGMDNCMVTGPASGQCLQSSVVYGAAVKSTDTTLRTLFREEEIETIEFYTGSC